MRQILVDFTYLLLFRLIDYNRLLASTNRLGKSRLAALVLGEDDLC